MCQTKCGPSAHVVRLKFGATYPASLLGEILTTKDKVNVVDANGVEHRDVAVRGILLEDGSGKNFLVSYYAVGANQPSSLFIKVG